MRYVVFDIELLLACGLEWTSFLDSSSPIIMENAAVLPSEEEEIRVPKLSHAIAERLRGQIVGGQRKAGDRLPPESDLLAQFKVSRPTIREALRILEVESLISLGRGARTGAVILGPTVERAAEYAAMVLVGSGTTVAELHGARALLEPEMVSLLAKKRDKQLIEALQLCLEEGSKAHAEADYQKALGHINDFHTTLVRASENRAVVLILEMLKVLAAKTTDALVDGSGDSKAVLKANMTKTLTAYQALVDLLRQGKSDEAQAFWKKYMERAQTFLEKTGVGSRKLTHG